MFVFVNERQNVVLIVSGGENCGNSAICWAVAVVGMCGDFDSNICAIRTQFFHKSKPILRNSYRFSEVQYYQVYFFLNHLELNAYISHSTVALIFRTLYLFIVIVVVVVVYTHTHTHRDICTQVSICVHNCSVISVGRYRTINQVIIVMRRDRSQSRWRW